MSELRRVWRACRREFWLGVSAFATGRALDLCEMPEDEATIRRIRDSLEPWVRV